MLTATRYETKIKLFISKFSNLIFFIFEKHKLTIQCDKLENFQFYQSLIDSVKVKVPENDQRIFSKIRAKDRIKRYLTKTYFTIPLKAILKRRARISRIRTRFHGARTA